MPILQKEILINVKVKGHIQNYTYTGNILTKPRKTLKTYSVQCSFFDNTSFYFLRLLFFSIFNTDSLVTGSRSQESYIVDVARDVAKIHQCLDFSRFTYCLFVVVVCLFMCIFFLIFDMNYKVLDKT